MLARRPSQQPQESVSQHTTLCSYGCWHPRAQALLMGSFLFVSASAARLQRHLANVRHRQAWGRNWLDIQSSS